MLEYIIIGLLCLVIILLFILIFRKNNNSEMTEKLGKFETNITKSLGDFKYEFARDIDNDFKETNAVIEKRLNYINDKVNERLDYNFEKTNKTFNTVLERIGKIDEAQKKIDGLSEDILSLQSVLTDKKTRGIFGEANLNYILSSVFGDVKKVYTWGDIQSQRNGAGIILLSPNGTKYKLTVANDGTLTTTLIN